MNLRTALLTVALVFLFVCTVVYYWPAGRPALRSPEELLALAQSGSDPPTREAAAAELTQYGTAEVERYRVLAREGGTAQARAIGCDALGNAFDYDSMDFLFQTLNDDSVAVRASAATAIGRMLGRQYPFPAAGTAEEREVIAEAMQADWEKLRQDPYLETFKEKLKVNP